MHFLLNVCYQSGASFRYCLYNFGVWVYNSNFYHLLLSTLRVEKKYVESPIALAVFCVDLLRKCR